MEVPYKILLLELILNSSIFHSNGVYLHQFKALPLWIPVTLSSYILWRTHLQKLIPESRVHTGWWYSQLHPLWQEFRWTGLHSSDRNVLSINTLKDSLLCQHCCFFNSTPACTGLILFWNFTLAVNPWDIYVFFLIFFLTVHYHVSFPVSHQEWASVKHLPLRLGLSHWNNTVWQCFWGSQ